MRYNYAIAEVVVGFLSQKSRLDPRAVPVGCVLDRLLWDRFFWEYFGIHLSLSSHQWSIFISIQQPSSKYIQGTDSIIKYTVKRN
jgi:hypothetical protein